MSTWNTEPPEDNRDVLIKDVDGDSCVVRWDGSQWRPSNVFADSDGSGGIHHDLYDDSIVWQELPE